MGINRSALRLLLYAKKLGASYEHTLTLGRLKYYAEKNLEKYSHFLNDKYLQFTDEYSETIFRSLGAQSIQSLDYSDYEKADIIHDLNIPFPVEMQSKYSMLVDSGTLEHVFNFPVAIKSCMQALKIGGYFVGITPANNMMGHGFYQFSPELYYRIFSEENGFRIVKLMITSSEEENQNAQINWYEVPDPKTVHSRIMLANKFPMYLLVIAQKIKEVEVFKTSPQQSDYALTWEVHESLKNNSSGNTSAVRFIYRKYIPKNIKTFMKGIYDATLNRKIETDELGSITKSHFIKIDIEKILNGAR